MGLPQGLAPPCYSRVASQLVPVAVQCTQPLFGFIYKMLIGFKVVEPHLIVNMLYADAGLAQVLSVGNILVPVLTVRGVQRVVYGYLALYTVVGRVKILVGMLASACGAVPRLSLALI